jgi:hypothetical protein
MTAALGSARRLVGGTLVVVAAIYLTLFFLILTGLGARYLERGDELTDKISRWGIVGPFITGFGLLLAGIVLREGKKRSLLFLRPFNSIANEVTMNSMMGRVGRRFTAVALDDGSIPAPSSSLRDVALAFFFFLPAGILMALAAALAMPQGSSSPAEEGLQRIAANLPTIFALILALFAFRKTLRSIVPKSNKHVVDTKAKLDITAKKVAGLSTWAPRIFFARSLILQSTDALWKDTVKAIGQRSDFAIIDLSRVSKSVAWELNYLKQEKKGKFAIMAEENARLPTSILKINAPVFRYNGDPSRSRGFASMVRNWLETL